MHRRGTLGLFRALRTAGRIAAVAGLSMALLVPASAQFWSPFGGRPAQPQRQQPPQQGFNPFSSLFGGPQPQPKEAPVDYSRAPASQRKADPAATTTVAVMGDGMADWLAYGLEEAFAEQPEIAIVRKHRTTSGLIRYDARRDVEWPQVAKEIIAADKPKLIVMMVGLHDRQPIRERAPAAAPGRPKAAAAKQQSVTAPPPPPAPLDPELQARQSADQQNAEQNAEQKEEPEEPAILAPEVARGTNAGNAGPLEFRSERWEASYIRRIDATIAAMKSAGVPALWVGLPPQRVARASADTTYLNELYRQRAEKAGIVFVDVWEGFVDSAGQFAAQGPDFEGQIRRLRSGDGVYFTKAGARKLAHYVEREIQRSIANRALPMALPTLEPVPAAPGARPGGPAQRPLAGPIVPLTVSTTGQSELLGGGSARPAQSDPVVVRVLTRGEAIPAPSGRADDFSWPRGSAAAEAAPVEVSLTAPAAASQAAPTQVAPSQPVRSAPVQPALRQAAPSQPTLRPAAPSQSAPGQALTGQPKGQPTGGAAGSKTGEPKQQSRRPVALPPADGVPRPPAPIRPSASVTQGAVR